MLYSVHIIDDYCSLYRYMVINNAMTGECDYIGNGVRTDNKGCYYFEADYFGESKFYYDLNKLPEKLEKQFNFTK